MSLRVHEPHAVGKARQQLFRELEREPEMRARQRRVAQLAAPGSGAGAGSLDLEAALGQVPDRVANGDLFPLRAVGRPGAPLVPCSVSKPSESFASNPILTERSLAVIQAGK